MQATEQIWDELEPQPWTAKLSPADYAATKAKIDKINARAVKRGHSGRLALNAEVRVVTTKNLLGMDVERVWYECTITGEPPRLNGWQFLARVDLLPGSTEFTLALAPGAEGLVDRSMVKPGHCDHCDSRRRRKNSYLVRNDAGEVKNVGSTCIKDFLGWQASFSFKSAGEWGDELFGGTRLEDSYTPRTVITAAFLAIKKFGWARSGDTYSTKSVAIDIIDPPLRRDNESFAEIRYREQVEACAALLPEAAEKVPAILEWVATLDDSSEFNINLKVAAAAAEIGRKQIGVLAYAPEGYARHLGKVAEWKAKAEAASTSDFIGSVGDKVTVSGTVESVRHFNGDFGVSHLYTIRTEAGIVKWWASREALSDEPGTPVTLAGTVKKHEEFHGLKSTVLTRCREVSA